MKILYISKFGNAQSLGNIERLKNKYRIDYLCLSHPIWHPTTNKYFYPIRDSIFPLEKIRLVEEKVFPQLNNWGVQCLQSILPNPQINFQSKPGLFLKKYLQKENYQAVFLEYSNLSSDYADQIRKFQPWVKIFLILNKPAKQLHKIKFDEVITDFDSTPIIIPELASQPLSPVQPDYVLPQAKFSPEANPEISIIILSHNSWKYTELCLQSLSHAQQHSKLKVEYIVLDNGSSDGSAGKLKKIPGLRVITQSKNLGYPAGLNFAIKRAKAKNFLFLNNDTVVAPGWLDRLHAHAERIPNLGLLAPSTNTESGQAHANAHYNSLIDFFHFHEYLGANFSQQWELSEKLSGLCLYMPRSTWDSVGPFDEAYGLGYFEDDDYCLRTKAMGKKIVWAKDVFIHHFGSISFAHKNREKQLERGMQYFIFKWGPKALVHIEKHHRRSLLKKCRPTSASAVKW